MCGRNELNVCTMLEYPHISSFRTMPVLYTSTCILKPFEDSELMGLNVDITSECLNSQMKGGAQRDTGRQS